MIIEEDLDYRRSNSISSPILEAIERKQKLQKLFKDPRRREITLSLLLSIVSIFIIAFIVKGNIIGFFQRSGIIRKIQLLFIVIGYFFAAIAGIFYLIFKIKVKSLKKNYMRSEGLYYYTVMKVMSFTNSFWTYVNVSNMMSNSIGIRKKIKIYWNKRHIRQGELVLVYKHYGNISVYPISLLSEEDKRTLGISTLINILKEATIIEEFNKGDSKIKNDSLFYIGVILLIINFFGLLPGMWDGIHNYFGILPNIYWPTLWLRINAAFISFDIQGAIFVSIIILPLLELLLQGRHNKSVELRKLPYIFLFLIQFFMLLLNNPEVIKHIISS
jgi:hypothetical protein